MLFGPPGLAHATPSPASPTQGEGANRASTRAIAKVVRPLMIDAYHVAGEAGSFILIDEVSNETVAGGIIVDEDGK